MRYPSTRQLFVQTHLKTYVTYLQISTQLQRQSGLGLEAQRAAVRGFVQQAQQIIREYIKVESGNKDARTQLVGVIEEAKQTGSVSHAVHSYHLFLVLRISCHGSSSTALTLSLLQWGSHVNCTETLTTGNERQAGNVVCVIAPSAFNT